MGTTNSLAFFTSSNFSPIIHSGLRRSNLRLPHSVSRATFSVHKLNRKPTTNQSANFSATTNVNNTPPPTVPKVVSADSILSTNPTTSPSNVLTFQEAIQRLSAYWASKGCIIWHPYNVEVGAGTMNPATFLRVLGPEPWSVAYDEPSIRPDDSRYGENPNRLQRHTQFQVILKPAPENPQELVAGSYQALGIDTCSNDIRFVEDNWESPALGAWGLGWEIWLNGMEITQFTYFQQAGGIPLDSIAVEITYGLERIIMALQGKSHFKDIIYSPGITYGDIFMQNEIEMSRYNMDNANIKRNKDLFQIYESEALELLDNRLPIPAYNYVLKASHTFNILDARGAIGVTERARYFQRMRSLSRDVARLWLAKREEAEFPLLSRKDGVNQSTVKPSDGVEEYVPATATADFVLEIGLEELPAGDVLLVLNQVDDLLSSVLKESRLGYSNLRVDGTPRRIIAFIGSLQTRQTDEIKRVRGPPLSIALKEGKMTKAGMGFMKSQGVTEESIDMNESDGYMYATVEQKGRNAKDVLSDKLPSDVLERINFGKSMKWNDTGVSFSRPLRWLLCLLDDIIIPFEYAGVISSNYTRSLRGSDGFANEINIKNATQFEKTLENLQIVVSRTERKKRIEADAMKLAKEVGGMVSDEYLNGNLMEEIVDLVENPIPLIGSFDESFLELPKEVLESVMKSHQRYLPIIENDDTDKLMNKFITVANGNIQKVDIDLIRKGNEAVLRARYSDASFFYEKDTKDKNLEDFISKLSGLTFQETLGSMLDKKNRVESCVEPLSKLLSLSNNEMNDSLKIAKLYKADLVTSMVIEMTSLAGIIGKHYTIKSGEVSTEVSDGIFEANLPRFSGDKLAKSKSGALVAIADRMDSLVGLFSVGLIPKSTSDPFALRRATLGIVQTLVSCHLDVDVRELMAITSNSIIKQTGKFRNDNVKENVLEFISKRLEGYLLDNVGIRDDIVKCSLGVERNRNNPLSALVVCETLKRMIENDKKLVSIAQDAHVRADRLLGSVKDFSIEDLMQAEIIEDLFECDEERALNNALKVVDEELSDGALAIEDQFSKRMECLVRMKNDIDAFFDDVFVNAEDVNVRKNRLALCARIVSITRHLGDLSLLVIV